MLKEPIKNYRKEQLQSAKQQAIPGLFKIILGGGNILRYGNRIYSIPLTILGNEKKGNKNTRNILRNILLLFKIKF